MTALIYQNDLKDQLLLTKAPPHLSDDQQRELNRISCLDVSSFKEADVREEIVNPLLKILGYQKGNEHSVDREKHLKFVGSKNRYIDYNLTIWEQDFWLVEAKRPLVGKSAFGYKEVSQAFEYAAHPEIRAALVVVCDGLRLELFDREVNVESPILKVDINNLETSYPELATYLSPLNVWFFYRRRLLRELNRAFEKEGNLSRVSEFQDLMSRELQSMRQKVIENSRARCAEKPDEYPKILEESSPSDVAECHFFVPQSAPAIATMSKMLLQECEKNSSFHTLYRLFPDSPRDANDLFWMHCVDFLIELGASEIHTNWFPSWLGGRNSEEDRSNALKVLLPLVLSQFESDEARKTISLASSAYRRIGKIVAVISPEPRQVAELQHILTRTCAPENSWAQLVSSASGNLIHGWEKISVLQTNNFVHAFSGGQNGFKTNLAKSELQRTLKSELDLLKLFPNYLDLLAESDFGELHPTEAASVVYDNLGHGVLCVVRNSEQWAQYVISNHENLVIELAQLGSWSAKELLGEDIRERKKSKFLFDRKVASRRFFFGDEGLFSELSIAYGNRI